MRRRYILLVLVIGGVIAILFSLLAVLYNEGEVAMISNAKELKINDSEIGMGVEKIKSRYISDPADFFKRGGTRANQSFIFELGAKLEECGVKDGLRLQLHVKPREPALLSGYAVDFYVFNDTIGAKKFFDYIKKETNGSSASEIGDEAAYSEERGCWIVRTSNAVLLVGSTGIDGKDTGRIIAEKIVEKVKKS
jgi:hypothetical protein